MIESFTTYKAFIKSDDGSVILEISASLSTDPAVELGDLFLHVPERVNQVTPGQLRMFSTELAMLADKFDEIKAEFNGQED